jgi:hypothetical protein
MTLRLDSFIILIFLIFVSNGKAQTTLSGIISEKNSRQPVSFANIAYQSGNQGAISDLNGKFTIDTQLCGDTLRVSCIGYRRTAVAVKHLLINPFIELEPETFTLTGVDVFPGVNPAVTIMKQVVAKSDSNNPDKALNYRCNIYHKMAFRLEMPDELPPHADSTLQNLFRHNQEGHLMLIESVSEKKHLLPNLTYEKLITGRVSGLTHPAFSFIPAQIQSFTFYEKQIQLLGTEYLNPVSEPGITLYQFYIRDTLMAENGDTLLYISFAPRQGANINGLKGSLHIHLPTMGIKTVTAETATDDAPVALSIRQNYTLINNQHWFPEQMESQLAFKQMNLTRSIPYPITGVGKSYVTAVEINPLLKKNEFSSLTFSDKTKPNDTTTIKHFRYEPLSRMDSMTYRRIDSLGRRQKLDRLVNFQISLLDGYIPMGYVKLDFRKLIDYNTFQGYKAGLGLWTSEKVSDVFSIGGYYVHSFKINDNNYGAGAVININKEYETAINLGWHNDYGETGSFYFLDGYKKYSSESFKKFLISHMNREEQGSLSIESRLAGYLKVQLAAKALRVTPINAHPFVMETQNIEPGYELVETGLKLRWAYQEELSFTPYGLIRGKAPKPVFWLNLTLGEGNSFQSFSYYKYELQAQHSFKITPQTLTTLRLTGATLTGTAPTSELYSAFGTYRKTGIEIPYTFATMRPGEFAATSFGLAHIRHQIPLRNGKPGKFKPEIVLSTNAGVAESNFNITHQQINTFSKGYYESGIFLNRLASNLLFNYGFSVHYRYGPYHMPNEINNWAFKIGIEIAL